MNVKLLIVLFSFTITMFFCSCTNQAYKRVAVDPAPTITNKKLLLIAYNRSFPQLPPGKVKSDTVIIIKSDTSKNNSVETTTDLIKKYVLSHPCNPDTSAIAALIKAGIKPDVIHDRIETTIHDSIPWEDHERLNALQLKYEDVYDEDMKFKSENAALKTQLDGLKAKLKNIYFVFGIAVALAAGLLISKFRKIL